MKLEIQQQYELDDGIVLDLCPVDSGRAVILVSGHRGYSLRLLENSTISRQEFEIDRDTLLSPRITLLPCGLALLNGPSELLVFDLDSWPTLPQIWPIRGQLPDKPSTGRFPIKITAPGHLGVTDSLLLPVHIEFATAMNEGKHLTFIRVNPDDHSAAWLCQKFSDLLEVPESDLPQSPFHANPGFEHKPIINHSLLQDDQLFVFTPGDTNSPKFGQNYCAVLQVSKAGKKMRELFKEIYHSPEGPKNERKYGKVGRFSQSGEFCILNPIYQADEWKGSRLLSLSSGTVIEPRLPRGFSKHRIQDHGFHTYWTRLNDSNRTTISSFIYGGKHGA